MLKAHIETVWDYCQSVFESCPVGSSNFTLKDSVFSKTSVTNSNQLKAYLVGESLASLQFQEMPEPIFHSTCAIANYLQNERTKKQKNRLRFEKWLDRPFKLVKSKFIERHLFDLEHRPWRPAMDNISILLEQNKSARMAMPLFTLRQYQESLFGEFFGKGYLEAIFMNHFLCLCEHTSFEAVIIKPQAQSIMMNLFTNSDEQKRFGITSLLNIPLHLFLNRESIYFSFIIKRTAKKNFENKDYSLLDSILADNKDRTLGTLFINEFLLHYYLSKHEHLNLSFSAKLNGINPLSMSEENRAFAQHLLKFYAISIYKLTPYLTQAVHDLWKISGKAPPSLKQAQDGIFGAAIKIPLTYRPFKRFQYAECDSPFETTKITHSFADGVTYLASKHDRILLDALPYQLILLAIKAGLTDPYEVLCNLELTKGQTEEITEMMINSY